VGGEAKGVEKSAGVAVEGSQLSALAAMSNDSDALADWEWGAVGRHDEAVGVPTIAVALRGAERWWATGTVACAAHTKPTRQEATAATQHGGGRGG